ncbi:hypothetical protein RB653_001679 [Dictyostelium firmibasis]|uniref:N-acetyltransferase domain-containing protein n=1 Tax=Dictyostelium firmibasis TaxID=79012 RepID=A0AAN7TYW9_9MYCE
MFKTNKLINKISLHSFILPTHVKRLSMIKSEGITHRFFNSSNISNSAINNSTILSPTPPPPPPPPPSSSSTTTTTSTNFINNIQNINTTKVEKQQILITPNDDNKILNIPTLIGNLVTLRPLSRNDREGLLEASKEGELHSFKLTIVPGPNTIDKYLDVAFTTPSTMPFAIINNKTGSIIGTTRYWKVDTNNRKLEIGHTWLSLLSQKTGINTECKYLLLKYAFEEMNSVRVQFTTDQLNEKSRNAILRVGAKFEGVVRHERIMPDGRKRNSLRFSIIDSEWDSVKLNLEKMMNKNYHK